MRLRISLALLLAAAGLLTAADRYHTFLYGVAYYPEHWPESYWERDAKLMQEAGVNAVRMAEFAWYLMEPKEGAFDFSVFDRAIALLGRHGIKTILGTPTAAPPKWLTSKYPEVLAVYPDGRPADDQSRRHTCFNSPVYRRLSKRIVEAMAEHFKDNPNVIGWQIDNEFNCHIHECYSDSCRNVFREWLRERYGNLDSLNTRWGNAFWSQWYSAWEQVDLPFPTPAYHNPALMLDYRRFTSDSVISYQHDQVEIIRKYRPNDFITHNGSFKYIDYYRFSRDLDIFAHDNYPCFWEKPQYGVGTLFTMSRGFRGGRFMIMEEQTGPGGQAYLLRAPRAGEMSMWSFQAIAHGADGLLHFRWRTARKGAEEYWSGVLEHDNVPRARYQEFKREGAQIRKLAGDLFGAKIVSDFAVLKDYDDEWAYDYQFMTKEVNVGKAYEDFFQAASELKHNIDFIGAGADFGRYKVIFAPYALIMDPDLASKIRVFVERGGTFVLGAHSAVKDRDNGMTEKLKPILLNDVFGVEVDDFQCYQPPSKSRNAVRFDDAALVPVNVFADVLKPAKAAVLARWEREFKGAPACTLNKVGKGNAVYYGSFFNLEAARYLIRRFATAYGLKPLMTGLPPATEVTRRTKGTTDYYFVLNHDDQPVSVKPGAGYFDLLAGADAPAEYTLKPFEYKVLRRVGR